MKSSFLSFSLALFSLTFIGGECSKKSISEGKETISSKTYEWKMVTSWPPNFPILDEAAKFFAKRVEEMSAGQIKIRVYGAGELVPAFEVFENVSTGSVQLGHSAPYYWAGKIPGAVPFTTVPFGLSSLHQATWVYQGEGQKLWNDLYNKYNVVPFYAGGSGVQMGGWFNKKINKASDLKGLKMRIPGWGGKVLSEVGGAAVTLPAGEIYTGLERGTVDAAEWIGPGNDLAMGFQKVAKYYYYPGWHEPGTSFEVIVNKPAFESLPKHLQSIIESAAGYAAMWTLTRFEMKSAENLKQIGEGGAVLKKFPDDVIKALKKASDKVVAEEIEKDADLKKIYNSYNNFKSTIGGWHNISEGAVTPYLYK